MLSLLATLPLAHAQDDDESTSDEPVVEDMTIDMDALMNEIDLGSTGKGGGPEGLTYSGMLSETAPGYVKGKPVSIAHTGGPIEVRCTDQEGISARLSYSIMGSDEGPMESMGKSIGLSAWGNPSGGGVSTRIPGMRSGVSGADISLVVNLPLEADVKVSGGKGLVSVANCKGKIAVSNTQGGAFVSGTLTNVSVQTNGTATVKLSDKSEIAGQNKVATSSGDVKLELPLTYAGKFYAKGKMVRVFHTVAGQNDNDTVSGTIGTGSASFTVTAPGEIDVKQPG